MLFSKVFAIFILTSLSSTSLAHNMKTCFDYRTKGGLRKYDFKYLAPSTHPSDSVNCSVPTDTTSKEGLTKYSTESSTQTSTMSMDSKVSTNTSTGQTQFTSSFGACSMIGQVDLEAKKDAFIASNYDLLRREIAIGSGQNLDTLMQLTNCDGASIKPYIDELRQSFDKIQSPLDLSNESKRIENETPGVKGRCKIGKQA